MLHLWFVGIEMETNVLRRFADVQLGIEPYFVGALNQAMYDMCVARMIPVVRVITPQTGAGVRKTGYISTLDSNSFRHVVCSRSSVNWPATTS